MDRFRVALVSHGDEPVPAWVAEDFAGRGIEFLVGECHTSKELGALAENSDVLWVFGGGRVLLDHSIRDLPRCVAILRTGAGTDNIPVAEATELGIIVATTPDAGTESVAEHAAALIFAAVRQVALQDRFVREGRWDVASARPRWTIQNESLGLIGFGRIARALARKLSSFELSVLAHDPLADPEALAAAGVRPASLAEVLARSRIVSLHCPLTSETHGLIGEAQLRAMRPDAILINVARGPLVDESVLYRALTEGWIAAAALDVFETEPVDPHNPLLELDNVVLTAHIASHSETFMAESWRLSVQTVVDLSQGRWPAVCANPGVPPRREFVRS